MEVIFRCDASITLGMGHVMRCLSLAGELKRIGANILFIIRGHQGHPVEKIRSHDHSVVLLPEPANLQRRDLSAASYSEWLGVSGKQDADETIGALRGQRPDWLVVDHYGIDHRWHRRLIPRTRNLLVIDDLADRWLHCNVLLDQTFGRKREEYENRVNDDCTLLLGSEYALLRREFRAVRDRAKERRHARTGIHAVLVSMGGTDPDNVTSAVLMNLEKVELTKNPKVDVIIGSSCPHIDNIYHVANMHPLDVSVSIDADDMAIRMLNADIAIGAGGTTAWERCCVGLPTVVVCLAENQRLIANNLEFANATVNIEKADLFEGSKLANILTELDQNSNGLFRMSEKCFRIVDGLGAQRVAEMMRDAL